jgi:L-threonylcarbamoyladenylate synthase
MLASHYAPRARVLLAADADDAERLLDPASVDRATIGLLALDDVLTPPGVVRLSAPADAAGYARVLYAALREADALRLRTVVVLPPPPSRTGSGTGSGTDGALAAAITDRLRRAAHAIDSDAQSAVPLDGDLARPPR